MTASSIKETVESERNRYCRLKRILQLRSYAIPAGAENESERALIEIEIRLMELAELENDAAG